MRNFPQNSFEYKLFSFAWVAENITPHLENILLKMVKRGLAERKTLPSFIFLNLTGVPGAPAQAMG